MIYNEDFLEGIIRIESNSIDLIITDPPFGVEIQNNKYFDDSKNYVFDNLDSWIFEMFRVLKDNSHCYIYVPSLEIDKWVYNIKTYFELNNILGARNFTTHKYISNNYDFSLQLIIYCSKGKAKELNHIEWIKTSNSWYKDKRNKNPVEFTHQYPSYIPKEFKANKKPNQQIKLLHPCQKNDVLIEKFVLNSSQENEIVLDPFCGSGVVCATANKLNRKYLGFEINKDYYDKAVEMIKCSEIKEKSKGKKMF